MTDARPDPLTPFLRLAEAIDDPELLGLVRELVELAQRETALVIEQTLIAADIASRTKAGDWFQNTELKKIGDDAGSILREYKAQRAQLKELKAALDARCEASAGGSD